jgi:hypothetical protein
MAPSAIALLQAWEAGAAQAPLARCPSLLHSLADLPPDRPVAELAVGQCDRQLFALRGAIFGDELEAVATCPACGAEVELAVSLSALHPAGAEPPAPRIELQADGYTIACRPVRNTDLEALDDVGREPGVADLLARCVLDARAPDGRTVAAPELPAAVGRAVLDALATSDPGAQTTLAIRCPCGGEWDAELDIRSLLWTELTDWVSRTLTEVHQLASTYGWSERDILAMSGWRRRWYLEAAGW